MNTPRDWGLYIEDMRSFAGLVVQYTQGIDRQTFETDQMRFDATVRNLELIGETATHIPQEVRTAHTQVPWRMLIATRNQLIHGYLGVDKDVVWSLATEHAPAPLELLKDL